MRCQIQQGIGQMESKLRSYVLAAAIVWAAILVATSLVLAGTPQFGTMLPILGGGAAFFVVILPAAIFRRGQAS
jgi:hypothetical protein